MRFLAAAALLVLLAARLHAQTAGPVVIDRFDDVSAWTAHPADGVALTISSGPGASGGADRSMQLDFGFTGGGYAIARREVDLDLPENYVISFSIRGEALPNTLELKLVDSTDTNVWWSVRRNITFPREWQTFTYRKRHISFAWGPAGGGEIRHVAAIEFAVTASEGGTGTVWIDDLTVRELPPPGAAPPKPVITASSDRKGHEAALAADGNPETSWTSGPRDHLPWIEIDMVEPQEFGGVAIDWAPGRHPVSYDVEISDDGERWRLLHEARQTNGGRDYIHLPETESRYFRLSRIRGFAKELALSELSILPLDWAPTREALYGKIAAEHRRGLFPRGISGEQSYWTVVGVDGDTREALFGEDGAIETGRGAFSVEPFLETGGRLITWADVEMEHTLEKEYLPIPSVRWKTADAGLITTAWAVGPPESSTVIVRYRVTGRSGGGGGDTKGAPITLHLAIRPFQVNPPSQSLNIQGGWAPVRHIVTDGHSITVNDETLIASIPTPESVRSTHFDGGDVVADYLEEGHVPAGGAVEDVTGSASGVLTYRFRLAPGEEALVHLAIPLHGRNSVMPPTGAESLDWIRGSYNRVHGDWLRKLGTVTLDLPGDGARLANTVRAQLAWILVNRAGPAIRPGTRSYARSWIRDGSLTSSALLKLGHPEPVRQFIEWFAPHQYQNGKIPCVVDYRGADPVPEHDSSGEFIFLVTEYYRYTGDRVFLERMWPRVRAAAGYLDSLRQERRKPEYQEEGKRHFFGLLPESISHEGYSAKPMHSYWDDFFAVKGFRDAVFVAETLGLNDDRRRLERIRAEFEADFAASIRASMKLHGIDFIPGSADMGDFDATSTTIALTPVGAEDIVPEEGLDRTFEHYFENVETRLTDPAWDAMTPYEARGVGAFLRLGSPDRAHVLSDFLLTLQRPAGWHVWAEVVAREARKPRFLGDMPHTWVGSDYIRSVLDILAWERQSDSTLVIGAGVKKEWVVTGNGVTVGNLRTSTGPLSYRLKRGESGVELTIDEGLRVPPGGIVVTGPWLEGAERVIVDGKATTLRNGSFAVRKLPAAIVVSLPQ